MGLNQKETIEIRQVANGYVVMPPVQYEKATATADSDRYVFQTFGELVSWLGAHFTHRGDTVILDKDDA